MNQNATLETRPLNAHLAHSGLPFESLNFQAIIEGVAKRKASNGHTISYLDKKGKMTLFSGVAAQCKSQMGLSPLDKLSDEQVNGLNREIATFWNNCQKSLLEEGYRIVGVRQHIPKVEYDLGDKRISGVKWLATQKMEKQAAGDTIMVLLMQKGELEKRRNNMDLQPSKYEREQVMEVNLKLELVSDMIQKLEREREEKKLSNSSVDERKEKVIAIEKKYRKGLITLEERNQMLKELGFDFEKDALAEDTLNAILLAAKL